ncbi:acetoin utilization protein AcuC [Gammaproteobacteria bacterium]
MTQTVSLYVGEELGRYGFGHDHPFGPRRQSAFWDAVRESSLDVWARLCNPVQAPQRVIERFHTPEYVALVQERSEEGHGYLDHGDTPVFKGVYEAAGFVVGSVLHAVREIMERHTRRAFIPIAGLHHARPERAAGFCVFNDLGVAIETLKREYGLSRIAYVDIDAHHGDGIYYSFESDPSVIFADTHEDGRYLYPGTGHAHERGKDAATGLKLNIPLQPGAQDEDFFAVWPTIEELLRAQRPEFILLQGGVDSLAGDPITHLKFSHRVHAFTTTRLIAVAEDLCEGRLVATGGGGYNLSNIARGWTAILRSLLEIEA